NKTTGRQEATATFRRGTRHSFKAARWFAPQWGIGLPAGESVARRTHRSVRRASRLRQGSPLPRATGASDPRDSVARPPYRKQPATSWHQTPGVAPARANRSPASFYG